MYILYVYIYTFIHNMYYMYVCTVYTEWMNMQGIFKAVYMLIYVLKQVMC